MGSAISLVLAILGLLGVGVLGYSFGRVRRPPVGASREHEVIVAGQKKVQAIEKEAADRSRRVDEDAAKARTLDPSDGLRDLIDEGEISR